MIRILLSAALTLLGNISFAEYRAFDLLITNTQTGKTRTVRSTLDQEQYPQYFYLSAGEVIERQDHWMCYERSEYFKPLCERPVPSSNP